MFKLGNFTKIYKQFLFILMKNVYIVVIRKKTKLMTVFFAKIKLKSISWI